MIHRRPNNKTLAMFRRFGILWLALLPVSLRAADLIDELAALEAKNAGDFGALAAWCNKNQLKEEAEQARKWAVKRDPQKLYVFDLPDVFDAPANEKGDPAVIEWWRRWTQLRTAEADALFELAGKARRRASPRASFRVDPRDRPREPRSH